MDNVVGFILRHVESQPWAARLATGAIRRVPQNAQLTNLQKVAVNAAIASQLMGRLNPSEAERYTEAVDRKTVGAKRLGYEKRREVKLAQS